LDKVRPQRAEQVNHRDVECKDLEGVAPKKRQAFYPALARWPEARGADQECESEEIHDAYRPNSPLNGKFPKVEVQASWDEVVAEHEEQRHDDERSGERQSAPRRYAFGSIADVEAECEPDHKQELPA